MILQPFFFQSLQQAKAEKEVLEAKLEELNRHYKEEYETLSREKEDLEREFHEYKKKSLAGQLRCLI